MPMSSMLTPASPAAWNSRASSPGRSGMTTWTMACRPGPGRRACPGSAPPRRRPAPAGRPGPSGPGRRAAGRGPGGVRQGLRPPRPESGRHRGEHVRDRARRWRPGSASTGPVSPAAIRVTSRRPWPGQGQRAVAGVCASRAAMAAATTCGACETSATQRSCSAALTWTGSAPQAAARASIARETRGRGRADRGRSPRDGRGTGRPAPRPARTAPARTAGARARTRPGRSRARPGLAERQRLHAGHVGVAAGQPGAPGRAARVGRHRLPAARPARRRRPGPPAAALRARHRAVPCPPRCRRPAGPPPGRGRPARRSRPRAAAPAPPRCRSARSR